jgi:ATP-binding cassette subfamily B protein
MVPIAIFSNIFHNRYKVIARRLQDLTGDMTTTIEEMATGVRIIKAFGRMPLMQRRFEHEARQIRETSLQGIKQRAVLWTELNSLPNLSLVAVLLVGGVNVVQGRLTIGGLVAFMSYVFMLIWPMDAIGWVLSMSEECQTASQRLNEVLDSHPEVTDRPGARPLERFRGRLEFRGVGFKYPKSNEWILRDFNLVVEPGETVGLVGRTGSGKTSLAYLVPRLYDVSEGSVLLDGIDVRDILLRSLRSHVGFAFEDPILFSASVHENLVMGRPIDSDEELKRAIEIAQAGFVWDLPWGLETRVGEQGYTLSGGQRQRLALARAVLGGPPLLVLDDPLSSVDVHTEAAIEEALGRVLEGVTGLLVVHRPSTLALADRVVLIDGGTVAAVGTHTELMRSNELYRALLSQQYDPRPEEVTA